MTAFVVIGALYGDEGKGLMVDYLVRKHDTKFTARFNGGSQCSHTVISSQQKHVFNTYGAGTLARANTYLSGDVVLNPFAFDYEHKRLRPTTSIIGFSQIRVTTMFDVMLSNIAEINRGTTKHGSCGIGMNETIHRDLEHPVRLVDVINGGISKLGSRLREIQNEWVRPRLEQLTGSSKMDRWVIEFNDLFFPHDKEEYEEMARLLKRCVAPIKVGTLNTQNIGQHIVMEGAQGLSLDEELGVMPYCTHSRTGLPNAVQAITFEIGQQPIQPVYVIRSYTTRHGAGPLKGGGEFITDSRLVDTTNVTNQWQDTIRYAPLDLQMVKSNIERDLARVKNVLRPKLVMTCLDQIGTEVQVYDVNGNLVRLKHNQLVEFVKSQLQSVANLTHVSVGPTADHVCDVN